jgi:copper chaperone CopZ
MDKRFACLAALLICGLLTTSVLAAQPDTTIVWVSDLHCASCAKKLVSKLFTVPGVVDVKTNVKKGTVLVIPEKTRQPSPKSIWEEIEKADFTPTKLRCPTGVFEKKPTR